MVMTGLLRSAILAHLDTFGKEDEHLERSASAAFPVMRSASPV
jgi:hypothetical protein